jgi:hypothetical protein
LVLRPPKGIGRILVLPVKSPDEFAETLKVSFFPLFECFQDFLIGMRLELSGAYS